MPWCAPIGSAMGPQNIQALRAVRANFPDVPLIVEVKIPRALAVGNKLFARLRVEVP